MNKRKSERIPSQSSGPAFKTTSIYDEVEYGYKMQINQLGRTIESLRVENGSIMYRAESYVQKIKAEFESKEKETRLNTMKGVSSLRELYQSDNSKLREELAVVNLKIEYQNKIIEYLRSELANSESRGNREDYDKYIGAS
jgi:hypothetical protein